MFFFFLSALRLAQKETPTPPGLFQLDAQYTNVMKVLMFYVKMKFNEVEKSHFVAQIPFVGPLFYGDCTLPLLKCVFLLLSGSSRGRVVWVSLLLQSWFLTCNISTQTMQSASFVSKVQPCFPILSHL